MKPQLGFPRSRSNTVLVTALSPVRNGGREMPTVPIDPAVSAPVALAGRIVTMDPAGTVLAHGLLYARDGAIVDVRPSNAPAPPGFEDIAVTHTGGTVFPGLIELHNHLPYDVLQLWPVPRLYTNRDQWSSVASYKQRISAPMRWLGADPDGVPAIVRYVEMRALLGGTTTSQGVALAKSPGIISHFRGLVRNVESTRDPTLPAAATHIADVEATDAEHFLARISGRQKLILHLSEGTDEAAHDAFTALHLPDGRWAITPNLVAIHCLALGRADFDVLAGHGGSMVWSPLSNLLLYGRTAEVGAAIAAGVPVALGSDWAPSGSKNVLGELKVARIAADAAAVSIPDEALVRMVTTTPARMLGWQDQVGSLEKGRRADLLVVAGTGGEPYAHLLTATEADLRLVMINGVARVGTPGLMRRLLPHTDTMETVQVARRHRMVNLAQVNADPSVAALSVAESIIRLHTALAAMNEPPAATDDTSQRVAPRATVLAAAAFSTDRAVLAASQVVDNHMSPRPHLPLHGQLTGPNLADLTPSALRSTMIVDDPAPHPAETAGLALDADAGFTLDPLAAVDNPGFYTALAANPNLPDAVRGAVTALTPADIDPHGSPARLGRLT